MPIDDERDAGGRHPRLVRPSWALVTGGGRCPCAATLEVGASMDRTEASCREVSIGHGKEDRDARTWEREMLSRRARRG
jgi:hypothetical protein